MTQSQMDIVKREIILLDKEDLKQLTGWGENAINKVFAYNEDFPATKIGKKYQVELGALKEFFKKRRTN